MPNKPWDRAWDPEWEDLLAMPNVVLLDVRNADELEEEGAIDGALHIPCRMASDPAVMADALPSDKMTPILVFCAVGGRSARVAVALRAAGYSRVANGGGWESVRETRLTLGCEATRDTCATRTRITLGYEDT
eukprot:CAMPEP_0119260326 /NCGR_PEP_ID=MMETSP1329-20130426/764_1 /TAXON_ID=114041 /ORGANISM="Genus nov. species nov., Strain RCC1024" /LENGTH=132 /DNA_ID=CAMNT_0007259749 /DNA_START=212 /DNA_END=610 /DNA_ORIENTATION=+